MDAERFDRITRTVARSANRRTLLRSGVAGALAVLGMRAAHEQAAADDGFEGAPCFTSDCCGGLGLTCNNKKCKR